jgi:biopolymer transport protein ExbB
MQDPVHLGVAHFLGQADGLAKFLLLALLMMSVVTWYLILGKSYANWRMKRSSTQFLSRFWDAPGLASVAAHLTGNGGHDPYSQMTHYGLQAAEQYRNKTGQRLVESGSADEFLTRALRRAIGQNAARLEYGHTLLASIASSAPFIGLFGTVWGIYHALINIGMSGSGGLDQVAGPVGEALIMTALGLAVAIPAVLAYNLFNRSKRMVLTELDGFAHDLFAFMSTGVHLDTTQSQPSRAPLHAVAVPQEA